MPDAAIATRGLVRRFGSVAAVDGIDLDVAEGSIYGFLGPNGAGKSTVVRMLCTLLVPSAGEARVAGHDVVRAAGDVRLRIGVALQEAALDDKLTGRELLALQGRLYGLRPHELAERIDDVSPIVDVGALDRRVAGYSGGMRRRLDLAAALMHDPEVLFLDEPTTGLDPQSRRAVWDQVRQLNADSGTTVFLTTQYLEEADALADRVGIIAGGRLVADDTPERLKQTVGTDVITAEVVGDPTPAVERLRALPGVERVEAHDGELMICVTTGAEALSPVALALDAVEVTVSTISMRSPSLDDVFLRLTGSHLEDDR